VIAWHVVEASIVPEKVEDAMIIAFALAYGQPPFANDPQLLGRLSASRTLAAQSPQTPW
jgi:hypothetical protein